MNGVNSILIVSEDDRRQVVHLDEKEVWEVGRPYKENNPDIKLYSTTVSRKHGSFQNMDGIWFYIDNHKKNGTAYNGRIINSGINGRIKPILLKDGDELIFGCGTTAAELCGKAKARFMNGLSATDLSAR